MAKRFRPFRALLRTTVFMLVLFLLPAGATLAWWAAVERPASWRSADWSSAGILPAAGANREAAIYLMSARTGGLKGALSVHSWIVLKERGGEYVRYDKVGWGMPVRRNAYAADGRWYSNLPVIVHSATGAEAERLIPEFERAVAGYPYAQRGGYRLWPGPNSNSFVAHLLREVTDFGAVLPPNAVGRDYAPGFASVSFAEDRSDMHVTLGGLLGFAAGAQSGLELHLGGLVAGIDIANPGLKVPGFGYVPLFSAERASAAQAAAD